MTVDALEERLLHVEALDDGFDDPVSRRNRGQVLLEAAGSNECGAVRGEERIRLELSRARQSVAGGVRA